MPIPLPGKLSLVMPGTIIWTRPVTGSGADGYLGAGVQVESLEGPDLARRRTGRGKTPDQGAVGDVAFAFW